MSHVLRLVSDVMLECNITAFWLHVVIVTHRGTALSGRDAGHVTKNIQPLNSVEEDGGVGLMKEWQ